MQLTPQAVDTLARECLFAADEPKDDPLIVEGITTRYGFHPGRVAERTDAIAALLAELPHEFQTTGGGGWSFLNACNDKHGRLWTGEHRVMEALLCLGIAAGKARWQLPRELWSALPGGMPYVSVN